MPFLTNGSLMFKIMTVMTAKCSLVLGFTVRVSIEFKEMREWGRGESRKHLYDCTNIYVTQ